LFENWWEVIEEHAQGDGQFDAFECIGKIYKKQKLQLPKLIDYAVRILGSSSDALCETIITWTNNGKEFKTRD
jgi:D-citramalate synthase